MPEISQELLQNVVKEEIHNVLEHYLKLECSLEELQVSIFSRRQEKQEFNKKRIVLIVSLTFLLTSIIYQLNIFSFIFGIRCVIPNNYFIWEATRPISDCNFCSNVTKPVILHNISKETFNPYAYSSQPIVARGAFLYWPAKTKFSWHFFKELYADIEDSYKSVEEECQFLHFKSDFISIKDVFSMSEARSNNKPGERSWYVGWGNCHPVILQEMRKYYSKPNFLPADSEIPHKEYVFMGYDDGATMHLDFINRLMWQAQLKGEKLWNLLPPPECQAVCKPVEFKVYPGDGVLVDTRVWYHATTIPNGQFSLSVQSEYG